MPRFPKGFIRRKSTANALEDIQVTLPSSEQSFRVFERPNGGNKSFDGGVKLAKGGSARPGSSTLQSREEDNLFDDMKASRGSGASNTNTASTTDNSSRFSAASTAPSSMDLHQDEWKSPHEKPFNNIPIPPMPKSKFNLKSAGRTFSFGRNKPTTPPMTAHDSIPSPQETVRQDFSQRSRAVTASSYASTATPPKLEERELGLSLGGDFSDMFSGFGQRQSRNLDVEENRMMSQSPDYGPSTRPPVPSKGSNHERQNQPSPLHLDRTAVVEASPNSWASHTSNEALMTGSSPLFSTQNPQTPPPVPKHTSPTSIRQQRPGALAEGGLRRSSAQRLSTVDNSEPMDEEARLLRESVSAAHRFMHEPSRARDSWINPTPKKSYTMEPSWKSGAVESTPRQQKPPVQKKPQVSEDNMFDHPRVESPKPIFHYTQSTPSPLRREAQKNKVMTPAQFERYKKDQERLSTFNSAGKQNDEENEDADAYDDDEDEAERQKQVAKQRRKQEAHMAVYRQQMMKVTGEAMPAAGQPSMVQSKSAPNLLLAAADEGEEEDEEVPLAILAAHGFPNKNKTPVRLSNMSSNPNLRASSLLSPYPAPPGSVSGGERSSGGGRLPVFARNLPQDPYFGAGLINSVNRESLAYGNSGGSVYGGSNAGPRAVSTPGGLVGVIASEERSRAMRRGSPNAMGEYSQPPPSNGFNGMGMPNMMQGMHNGNMPGMPMTAGDQAQMEMANQMQHFMQMQMQFMQMMAAGGGGSQAGQPSMQGPMIGHDIHQRSQTMSSLNVPGQLRPGSSHQRAMSSLDPNSAPWLRNSMAPTIHGQGMQGYTPSIAPSERSNIGQPGRYRPVSFHPGNDKSRSSTMPGALSDWTENGMAAGQSKPAGARIRVVQRVEDEEDDEEAWAAMNAKKEKKKSMWRTKKGKDESVLGF